jgi:hypothetical protein
LVEGVVGKEEERPPPHSHPLYWNGKARGEHAKVFVLLQFLQVMSTSELGSSMSHHSHTIACQKKKPLLASDLILPHDA